MEYLDLEDLAKELADLNKRAELQDDSLDEDDAQRLKVLLALQGQLFPDSLAEYAKNESLMILEDEFEDYAQEFAYDVGFVKRGDDNPLHTFIDWEAWADSIKTDYSEVTFDEDDYLIRAY